MNRTPDEWRALCQNITAGFTPGGHKEKTYDTGVQMAQFIYDSNLVWHGCRLLDLGSGNGRLAMGLTHVAPDIFYRGIDIIPQCVDFCKDAFRHYPNFDFHYLPVRNGRYYANNPIDPTKAVFPFSGKSFDVVIAFSVFSHIAPILGAKRYVDEVYRVLMPGGLFLSTWFPDPPNIYSMDEHKVVYTKLQIQALLKQFTRVEEMDHKAIPGGKESQLWLLAEKGKI